LQAIEQRGDDVWLRVRVQPKAARVRLLREGERYKVMVTAPPSDGLANRMVCECVAEAAGLAKSRVRVKSGDHSREKTLLLENCRAKDIEQRLASL
jgi:uncharacterized protein (TIGR00251 family)